VQRLPGRGAGGRRGGARGRAPASGQRRVATEEYDRAIADATALFGAGHSETEALCAERGELDGVP